MTQRETPVLADSERSKFEQDGYLTFDPGIPDDVIDGVVTDLEELYRSKGEVSYEGGVVNTPGNPPRIRDAWKISENVKAVALAPRALTALEELYDRRPMPFQSLNFPGGTQQKVHADAMHFLPAEPNYMCGVWVALEDIDMANGPLIYYPGSHRLPFASYSDVGFDAKKDDFPDYDAFIKARNEHYEEWVRDLLKKSNLQPEYGTLPKGRALIWASNLLHGGARQEDRRRTRHSQVTHFLFEGSFAYRTPMRTEGEKEYWIEPDLID